MGRLEMLLMRDRTSAAFSSYLSSTTISPGGVTRTATSPASCRNPSSA
jgi:hypothetical protein